jgi:hypothetical protein
MLKARYLASVGLPAVDFGHQHYFRMDRHGFLWWWFYRPGEVVGNSNGTTEVWDVIYYCTDPKTEASYSDAHTLQEFALHMAEVGSYPGVQLFPPPVEAPKAEVVLVPPGHWNTTCVRCGEPAWASGIGFWKPECSKGCHGT